MKRMHYSLLIFVLGIMAFSAVPTSAALPSDLVVTMDTTHMDYWDDHAFSDGLKANLTDAGSTFNLLAEGATFAIPTDTSVLLMPLEDAAWSAADLTKISDWYGTDGAKLIWVAGDSDYGGYYNFSNTNSILDHLGAKLRLASISIEDPVENDQSAYRVVSTGAITDGKVNAKLNEGVDRMVMHGPTGICALVDGEVVNPLTTDVKNVEVVRTSSPNGVGIDSDLSETAYDIYAGENNATIPMIGIEQLDSGKWLIVSGEAVFSQYKFMYGMVTEQGSPQQGATFTNNVLTWFSESGAKDSLSGFLPFEFAPFVAGLVAIVYIKRRK